MPVLVSTKTVDRRDDPVAVGHRQPSAGAEIVSQEGSLKTANEDYAAKVKARPTLLRTGQRSIQALRELRRKTTSGNICGLTLPGQMILDPDYPGHIFYQDHE